jgi:glycosyltransferase involved in cell wall biosynthesis
LKPDLVILQWWTSFWALANSTIIHYLKTHGFPVIYIIHNALPHEPHFFDSVLTKMALSPVNNFIALSPKEKARLKTILPDKHIDQVPLPFFINFSLHEFDKNQSKRRLGLPIEMPVILFFGIIRKYKGLKILLKALSILINQDVKIHLVIAGEFWKAKKHYLDIIYTNKISKWVTIDDRYIPDELVPLYFSAADAFIAPYTGGSQSAVQRIAMQFGLPIVLTKTIFDETIFKSQPKYPLFIINSNNETELATAIKQAVTAHPVQPHYNDGWSNLVDTIEELAK